MYTTKKCDIIIKTSRNYVEDGRISRIHFQSIKSLKKLVFKKQKIKIKCIINDKSYFKEKDEYEKYYINRSKRWTW